jgi:hypothetical protein
LTYIRNIETVYLVNHVNALLRERDGEGFMRVEDYPEKEVDEEGEGGDGGMNELMDIMDRLGAQVNQAQQAGAGQVGGPSSALFFGAMAGGGGFIPFVPDYGVGNNGGEGSSE